MLRRSRVSVARGFNPWFCVLPMEAPVGAMFLAQNATKFLAGITSPLPGLVLWWRWDQGLKPLATVASLLRSLG